jgi:hypothetical protein
MAAAAAAGQQFALITSQGIPFIQPGIPAIYSSPAGKCIFIAYYFRKRTHETYRMSSETLLRPKGFS